MSHLVQVLFESDKCFDSSDGKLTLPFIASSFFSKSSTGGSSNSPAAIAENAMRVATTGQGELDVPTMKKYIQYCKAKCAPRLSDEAGDILASSYVKIRDDVRKRVMEVSRHVCPSSFLLSNVPYD